MARSGPSILKKKDEMNRICRYCGVFRPQSETTWIPTTPAQLTKWIKILGPQFAKNIKKTKSNAICLNHIINRERGPARLPKKMAKHPKFVFDMPKAKKPKTGKYDHRVCRYCGESRTQSDMTWIPKRPEDLEKWIEILGPEFAENIKRYKANFICRAHIKNETRRLCGLPNTVQITSDGNEEDEEEQNQENVEENEIDIPAVEVSMEQDLTMEVHDLGVAAPIPEPTELKVPVAKEVNVRVNSTRRQRRGIPAPSMDEVEQMKPIPNNLIVKPDPSRSASKTSGATEMETRSSSTSTAENQNDGKHECRVCFEHHIEDDMMKAPTDSKDMKKWFNLLGEVFFQNIVLNPWPHYICLSHVPKAVEKMSESISENNPDRRLRRMYDNRTTCRYCGVSRSQWDMTRIPENPRQLSKWIDILGPEFAENIKHFKSNSICFSHIENQKRSRSRLPKKMGNVTNFLKDGVGDDFEVKKENEENQVKTEENEQDCVGMVPPKTEVLDVEVVQQNDEIVQCRVCGLDCNKDLMTETPTDPEKVLKMINILGPNYVKNVMANEMCKMCGISSPVETMVKVPKNYSQRRAWIQALGQRFARNIQLYNTNFVCRDHTKVSSKSSNIVPKRKTKIVRMFEDGINIVSGERDQKTCEEIYLDSSMPIPISFEILDGERVEKKLDDNSNTADANLATEVNAQVCTMVTSGLGDSEVVEIEIENHSTTKDAEIVNNQNSSTSSEVVESEIVESEKEDHSMTRDAELIESNERYQCRVCDEHLNKNMMTETPSDPEEMMKWFRILGPTFVQNIIHNSPPHLICIEDLRKMVTELCQKE